MKVIDLETKSTHNVVSIDYDTNVIVMESKEYGRTRNTLDKVRLLHDSREDLKGMTCVKPKLFWLIPFVGWFMLPYTLFKVENSYVEFNNYLEQVFILMSPVFLILGSLLIGLSLSQPIK